MELQIDPPVAFDGNGAATCQAYSEGSGSSIYGEELGRIEGRTPTASFDPSRDGRRRRPGAGPCPGCRAEPQPVGRAFLPVPSRINPAIGSSYPKPRRRSTKARTRSRGTVTFEGLGRPPDAGVGDPNDRFPGP